MLWHPDLLFLLLTWTPIPPGLDRDSVSSYGRHTKRRRSSHPSRPRWRDRRSSRKSREALHPTGARKRERKAPTAPQSREAGDGVFRPNHLGGGAIVILKEKIGHLRPRETHQNLRPRLVTGRTRCGREQGVRGGPLRWGAVADQKADRHGLADLLAGTHEPALDGRPNPLQILQVVPETHVSSPSYRLQRPLICRFPHRSPRRVPPLSLYPRYPIQSKLPAPSIASGYPPPQRGTRHNTRGFYVPCRCLHPPRSQNTRYICSCQEYSYQKPSTSKIISEIVFASRGP